jgi:hypothetical protein
MIVPDTTGNVKKCCQIVCKRWLWILNCPDPCHQLNLMMKDIMLGSKKHPKVRGFSEVRYFLVPPMVLLKFPQPMRIVSQITTYFSHSNYGKYQLQKELKWDSSQQGIVAGGATQFSTFATHVHSIIHCSDAMAHCHESGSLKFNTTAVSHLKIH